VYTLNGSPSHSTTSAFLPGSSEPIRSSSPSAYAGLIVIHLIATSSLAGNPARLAEYIALPVSWLRRWIPDGSSLWIVARAPAASTKPMFARTVSSASILKPPQSAHIVATMPSFASRSAILYASIAWWNARTL